MYATGIFSILSIFTSTKKHKWAKICSFLTLLFALIASILAKSVGTSGGEIRHTEIRANAVIPAPSGSEKLQTKKDD
jgi:hypothetical protein